MKLDVILYSDEDGWVIAECPAIPGCVSQGRDRNEALANITDAIQGCLKVRRDLGLPDAVEAVEIEVEA